MLYVLQRMSEENDFRIILTENKNNPNHSFPSNTLILLNSEFRLVNKMHEVRERAQLISPIQ